MKKGIAYNEGECMSKLAYRNYLKVSTYLYDALEASDIPATHAIHRALRYLNYSVSEAVIDVVHLYEQDPRNPEGLNDCLRDFKNLSFKIEELIEILQKEVYNKGEQNESSQST